VTPGLKTLTGNLLLSELTRCISPLTDYPIGTCLLVDADRTLCTEDTGRLVGQKFSINHRIRHIFECLDYHDEAFTAVSSVWSSIPIDAYFRELTYVASNIKIRKSWHEILQIITGLVPVIVVTAGIPQVWKIALSDAGYAQIPIIGGCHRELDEYAMSARAKGDIVSALRQLGWVVIAAGDSRVDLPMLAAANTALFVPDSKGSPDLRSKLNAVPTIRHLIVDEQRFNDIPACSPVEAAEMVLRRGIWNAG
jgi:hypothetical protein